MEGTTAVAVAPPWFTDADTWEQLARAFIRWELPKQSPDYKGLDQKMKNFSSKERHDVWICVAEKLRNKNDKIGCYVEALYNDPNSNSVAWCWLSDPKYELNALAPHLPRTHKTVEGLRRSRQPIIEAARPNQPRIGNYMNRSRRAETARETLDILKAGRYQKSDGSWLSLGQELLEMSTGTRTLEDRDLSEEIEPAFPENARLVVTGQSTFEALRHFHTTHPDAKVGCLNFASAKHPGGGFQSGAQAQEEALARSSGLYHSLLTQEERYYKPNRACKSCLYLDRIIISPAVPFFRNDEGRLLDAPIPVTVVTAPAPNAGAVRKNEPTNESLIEPVLRARAGMVIRAFHQWKITHLVLGAWGCGVFGNDPEMVAQAFLDLVGDGGPYAKCFQEITFAIYDPVETGDNYLAFQRVIVKRSSSENRRRI